MNGSPVTLKATLPHKHDPFSVFINCRTSTRSATAGEGERRLQWTCFHKVERSNRAASVSLDRLVRFAVHRNRLIPASSHAWPLQPCAGSGKPALAKLHRRVLSGLPTVPCVPPSVNLLGWVDPKMSLQKLFEPQRSRLTKRWSPYEGCQSRTGLFV
jgi:hypothetical protein